MDIVDIYFRDVRSIQSEDLVLSHLKFAIWVAKKYRGLGVPFEDLIQLANEGLVQAAAEWVEGKASSFAWFARGIMRRSLFREIRSHRYCIRTPELCERVTVSHASDKVMSQVAAADEDDRINTMILYTAMESLSDRHRELIQRILDGETKPQIAASWGVATSNVNSMEKRAIEVLCQILERPNPGLSLCELGVASRIHTKDCGNIRFLEARGERKTLSQWAKDLGVHKDRIRTRLKRGATIEQALFLDAHQRKHKHPAS